MGETLRSDATVVDAIERIALRWGVEDELDLDFKQELVHHFSTTPVCGCGDPKAADRHWESFEGTPHKYRPADIST